MKIEFYVVKDEDAIFVLHSLTPEVSQAFEGKITPVFATIKSPVTAGLLMDAERLAWRIDPMQGYIQDPVLLPAAKAQVFVTEWTLFKVGIDPNTGAEFTAQVQPTMQGYQELHPVVATAFSQRLEAILNPSPFATKSWIDYANRSTTGQGTP